METDVEALVRLGLKFDGLFNVRIDYMIYDKRDK
jgi:hypothetical protein